MVIGQLMRDALKRRAQLEQLGQLHPPGVAHQPLGHPQRLRGLGRDLRRQRVRALGERRGRDDLGDEPDLQRLRGVEHAAGEREQRGALVADHPLQEPRPTVAGDQPEVDERLAEPGARGGQADVAHAGQVQAGADRGAVDRGDRRHLDRVHRQRHLLDPAAVAVLQLVGIAGEGTATGLHVLDVATGREARAGAGEHEHRDIGRNVDPSRDGRDLTGQAGARQLVADVVAVQGQPRHAVGAAQASGGQLGSLGGHGAAILAPCLWSSLHATVPGDPGTGQRSRAGPVSSRWEGSDDRDQSSRGSSSSRRTQSPTADIGERAEGAGARELTTKEA